ncbi:MAG: Holliday junction resolvase RuvX, partial [Aestuariibacter sp.]|nr:Holliday junction resolvase RuvX [Aestuariibacter sp.]
ARPLNAIKAKHTKPDWHIIESLLQDWQPQKLIVGLPTQLNGENDEMTEPAKKFARQLHGRYHISVAMVDERLTTREAYNIAIENSHYKSKPEIDSIAAVLITESWLREHSFKSAQ